MWNAVIYVTIMVGTCPSQKCPFPWGIWNLDPCLGPTGVCHSDDILISFAIVAQLTRVLNTDRQTDRQTDRHTRRAFESASISMYDVFSNRPHLCTARRRCGLVNRQPSVKHVSSSRYIQLNRQSIVSDEHQLQRRTFFGIDVTRWRTGAKSAVSDCMLHCLL